MDRIQQRSKWRCLREDRKFSLEGSFRNMQGQYYQLCYIQLQKWWRYEANLQEIGRSYQDNDNKLQTYATCEYC